MPAIAYPFNCHRRLLQNYFAHIIQLLCARLQRHQHQNTSNHGVSPTQKCSELIGNPFIACHSFPEVVRHFHC